MREEDWMWEEQLPPPEDLMPISQSLITPDLALAFDIPSGSHTPPRPSTPPHPSNLSPAATDLADSAGNSDEPARTLKRPRLVWTPQLHKRFVDAVAHLGIKNAVPKTIMQLMSVDGLTRENVASHLQKYRLYLKRMQGLSSGAGCGPVTDAATEHLFASSPVPPHFLRGAVGGSGPDHFFPYVAMPQSVPPPPPPPPPPHHHRSHHHHHHPAAPQFHRQFGGGGVNVGMNGQFDLGGGFGGRPGQVGHPRVGIGGMHCEGGMPGYAGVDDLELGITSGGRKVLTLFPTGED
ncbi:hypothetical protein MLD38_007626 [Melastoma candidum]|uniref:Uncharacterized protein n=1 Tax=Melastoma candidum TaxID=119954 RepID=A0ACB9RRN9_9MYRT|nr:hypothetical protein MLD38_007626 [Melastoma candidum]